MMFNVDHLKRAVAERCNEQSVALDIDVHVIDSRFYAGKGDGRYVYERLLLR